ncbi:hypothetical protein PHISCL_02478 [Aspergillus sclerotialis]|uniref:Uncharacterized protein n=1 Tax=Aspergillus sclerotialis TaxID=2070753 RepID=A0A3A3A0M9_9EURO|nr:hypothetical protein PHISCL_02478 [Aspergillus sclerotialis]
MPERHKTDSEHSFEGQRIDNFKSIDEGEGEDGREGEDEDEDEDENRYEDQDEGEDEEEPVHNYPIDVYEDEDEEVQHQFEELSETRKSFWFHNYYIAEASAICVATQIKGPNPGLKAIAKVRSQIPYGIWSRHDMDPDKDYSWKEEYKFGDTAEMELITLRELTRRGSTCTPS